MVRPTALFGNSPLGTEDVVCVSNSRHEARMGEPKNQATGTAALLAVQREMRGAAATPIAARFGKPEEIARVVVFLASDDAAWLTGERISASGGLH